MTLGADYQGPEQGADRAVLLSPGAGADRKAPALVAGLRPTGPGLGVRAVYSRRSPYHETVI